MDFHLYIPYRPFPLPQIRRKCQFCTGVGRHPTTPRCAPFAIAKVSWRARSARSWRWRWPLRKTCKKIEIIDPRSNHRCLTCHIGHIFPQFKVLECCLNCWWWHAYSTSVVTIEAALCCSTLPILPDGGWFYCFFGQFEFET